MTSPMVSVRVITYNHEKYIAQCLEGILMQRTDFPFEVIVGEDCSTDRTREIVLEYQARFPEKIRVITSEQNVGGTANVIRVQQACRGKYHAICEGDDYWIDPLKLQKQADFMEAHPECTMCFHNAFVIPDGNPHIHLFIPFDLAEILTIKEVGGIGIPTASRLARGDVLDSLPEWRKDIWAGDLLSVLWCAHHGKIGYLKECMSVYRMQPEGLTAKISATPAKRFLGVIDLYQRFDQETGYRYTTLMQTQIERQRDTLRRIKLGRFYFLLHPFQTITRLARAFREFEQYKKNRGPNR